MTVGEIAKALGGNSSGDGWQAHCPAHDDAKSSLTITEDQGKILFHRHAGCSQTDVLNALKIRGLWHNKNSKSKIIKTYDYTDIDGKLLFQVVRYDNKDFKQRRPDNNGGWIWNLKDTQRVLYHLPDVIKAAEAGRYIFIVEGEKDADNLGQHFNATTNPGGAGKWRKEYTEILKSAKCVILPDNDPPGRKHAQNIAHELYKNGSVVKILELPNLPKGGDVSNWFEAGGTLEELKNLVKNTVEWKPENEENQSEDKKKIQTKTLIPNLIHLVCEEDQVKYLIKKNDNLCIEDFYINDGQLYQPKQDIPINLINPDILNESQTIEYKPILDKVIAFIRKYLELPHEQDYLVLSLWVLHTYLIEKFNVTPILYFFGIKETGKTRAGEVISEIAYRCERCTSPTEATLFRSADYFKTVLIIDEIKLWGPDGNKEVANLIKSRYKRGLKVSRVNMNKSGEDQIEYHDVFAPLVICSTETMPPIIESRCFTFTMRQNASSKVEGEIDEKESAKLRNLLTIFRFKYIDKDLPAVEALTRRRLNEITKPLFQICMLVDPDRKDEFTDFIKYEKMKRSEEEGEVVEADIVKSLKESGDLVENRKFSTKAITDELNKNLSEKNQYSSRYISSCIKRLGFEKTRLTGGKMGFRYDESLLSKLIIKYKISEG